MKLSFPSVLIKKLIRQALRERMLLVAILKSLVLRAGSESTQATQILTLFLSSKREEKTGHVFEARTIK